MTGETVPMKRMPEDFLAGLPKDETPKLMKSGLSEIARSILVSTAMPIIVNTIKSMITKENLETYRLKLIALGEKITGNTDYKWDDYVWEIVEKLLEPAYFAEYGIELLTILIGYLGTIDNTLMSAFVTLLTQVKEVLEQYEESGDLTELAGAMCIVM